MPTQHQYDDKRDEKILKALINDGVFTVDIRGGISGVMVPEIEIMKTRGYQDSPDTKYLVDIFDRIAHTHGAPLCNFHRNTVYRTAIDEWHMNELRLLARIK